MHVEFHRVVGMDGRKPNSTKHKKDAMGRTRTHTHALIHGGEADLLGSHRVPFLSLPSCFSRSFSRSCHAPTDAYM